MIEMEEIRKSFPLGNKKVQILKGISLFIAKGEFVSIMGPSGSGKSTLSSLLGCISTPTSGSYKINGQETSSLTESALATLRNEKIGFIFQDFNLLEGVSALENVALPLFYAGLGTKVRNRKALEMLTLVGLKDKAYHFPSQLSGGQKQRVAIARALVNDPIFLFADEPTGALDKKTGHEIMGLMQSLNQNGHTVVQVTHSAADANYSKRILHLVDGYIVKDQLVENPTIGSSPTLELEQQEWYGRAWRVAQRAPEFADGSATVDVLAELLKKTESDRSFLEAAKAIIRVNSPEADRLIEEVFQHSFWGVRAEIIRGCDSRDLKFSLPLCFRGLSDSNAWVRYLAMMHFKKHGAQQFGDKERELLNSKLEDSDERVRATAVSVLAQWRDPRALWKLIPMLEDSDARVRSNTLEALLFHRNNFSEKLNIRIRECLGEKNNRARGNAAVLVYTLDPDLAFQVIEEMQASENNLMRSSAAWALGEIKTLKSIELLIAMLKVENEEIVVSPIIRSLNRLNKLMPTDVQLRTLMDSYGEKQVINQQEIVAKAS